MSGYSFGWRVGVLALGVLSAVVIVGGWVLTQFDNQYDDNGVVVRLLIGIVAGLWAAGLFLPVTATIAVLVGIGAGLWNGARRRALTRPGLTVRGGP